MQICLLKEEAIESFVLKLTRCSPEQELFNDHENLETTPNENRKGYAQDSAFLQVPLKLLLYCIFKLKPTKHQFNLEYKRWQKPSAC